MSTVPDETGHPTPAPNRVEPRPWDVAGTRELTATERRVIAENGDLMLSSDPDAVPDFGAEESAGPVARLAFGLRQRSWVADGDVIDSALRLIDAKEALIGEMSRGLEQARAVNAGLRQRAAAAEEQRDAARAELMRDRGEAILEVAAVGHDSIAKVVAERDDCRRMWIEALSRADRAEERYRQLAGALKDHYLAEIVCDHDRKMDNPRCACSRVNLGWHPSVGAAVDAWITHLLAATAPQTAPSEPLVWRVRDAGDNEILRIQAPRPGTWELPKVAEIVSTMESGGCTHVTAIDADDARGLAATLLRLAGEPAPTPADQGPVRETARRVCSADGKDACPARTPNCPVDCAKTEAEYELARQSLISADEALERAAVKAGHQLVRELNRQGWVLGSVRSALPARSVPDEHRRLSIIIATIRLQLGVGDEAHDADLPNVVAQLKADATRARREAERLRGEVHTIADEWAKEGDTARKLLHDGVSRVDYADYCEGFAFRLRALLAPSAEVRGAPDSTEGSGT